MVSRRSDVVFYSRYEMDLSRFRSEYGDCAGIGTSDTASADSVVGRPNFGRSAGTVEDGNVVGVQFRQWTTSVLGSPLA